MSGHTGEFEDFCGKVFKDGRGVYRSFRAYADIMLRLLLEITVDTTNRELRVTSKHRFGF